MILCIIYEQFHFNWLFIGGILESKSRKQHLLSFYFRFFSIYSTVFVKNSVSCPMGSAQQTHYNLMVLEVVPSSTGTTLVWTLKRSNRFCKKVSVKNALNMPVVIFQFWKKISCVSEGFGTTNAIKLHVSRSCAGSFAHGSELNTKTR